ncbi:MAG TPA: hypothetical protein GXX75_09160 [Clostridiales bacterium]|nr:hypothetical protein [Clostridiales bacterium]
MGMRKRILVFLLILVVSCVPFLSLFYIDVNLHHECTGTECQVCAHIEAAIQNLNSYKNFYIPSVFLLVAVIVAACLCLIRDIICRSGGTLITLKVELLS